MKVNFQDIELAFDYVSSGQRFMNNAYISKETGQIYYHSEMYDAEKLPEDIDETEKYIEIQKMLEGAGRIRIRLV